MKEKLVNSINCCEAENYNEEGKARDRNVTAVDNDSKPIFEHVVCKKENDLDRSLEVKQERDVLVFESKETQHTEHTGSLLDRHMKEEPADIDGICLESECNNMEYSNEENIKGEIGKKCKEESGKCDNSEYGTEEYFEIKEENKWTISKNMIDLKDEHIAYSPRNIENFLEFDMKEEPQDIDYPQEDIDVNDDNISIVGNVPHQALSDLDCSRYTYKNRNQEPLTAENLVPEGNRSSSQQQYDINNGDTYIIPDINPDRHTIFHEENRNYECEECGECFSWKSSLDRHKVIHGVKNYKCETCGKCFPSKTFYDTHSMTHKGVEGYKCEECGKSYMWKIQLDRHKTIHEVRGKKQVDELTSTSTNKRPKNRSVGMTFKCTKCDKRFLMKSNLTNHLLLHQIEKRKPTETEIDPEQISQDKLEKERRKKYQCEVCDKHYSRKGDLKNHLPCSGSAFKSGCNTPFRWAFQNVSKSGRDYSKIVFPRNTNLKDIDTSTILGTIDHTTLKLSIV